VTDWHELLQITAPDDCCGLVFVRGNHPNTPDAILARAQRRDDGSKGTFGLKLLPNSDFTLGERITQGMANFRWPYTQYELKRTAQDESGEDKSPSGTYEMISFVKDNMVFQIVRITPGTLKWQTDKDSTGNATPRKGTTQGSVACCTGSFHDKVKHPESPSRSS
jgi:hypothetical protein